MRRIAKVLPMIIDIDCPLCRGNGRIETGEMERGPAGIGFSASGRNPYQATCEEGARAWRGSMTRNLPPGHFAREPYAAFLREAAAMLGERARRGR